MGQQRITKVKKKKQHKKHKQKAHQHSLKLKDTWIEHALRKLPRGVLLAVWVVLALLLYPVIGGILFRDSKDVDESALTWVNVGVNPSDNAFTLDDAIVEAAYEPENPNVSITKMIEGSVAWDKTFAASVVGKNTKTCLLIKQAAAKEHFEVPLYATGEKSVLIEEQQLPIAWRKAARVCALTAVAEARKGNINEALTLAGDIVHVGDMITHAQLPPTGYLIGASVKLFGLSALRSIAIVAPFNAKNSLVAQSMLRKYPSDPHTVTVPLQGEYLMQTVAIDQIESGKYELLQNVGLGKYKKFAAWDFYLEPNRTKNNIASVYKRIIAEASKSCIDYDPYLYRRNLELPTIPKAYFTRNLIGDLIYQFVLTPSTSFVEKRCTDDVNMQMTELIVALAAYKDEHGAYPNSLNLLFPRYLRDWPVDPYSGNGFHYDADDRTIASVGPKGAKDESEVYMHDSTGLVFTLPK